MIAHKFISETSIVCPKKTNQFRFKITSIVYGVRLKFISLVIIKNNILTRGYATRENIVVYDHS